MLAQSVNHSLSVGGGTLTYTTFTSKLQCEIHPGDLGSFTDVGYSSFSFNLNGLVLPLAGGTEYITGSPGQLGTCPANISPTQHVTFPTSRFSIAFTTAFGGGGSATTSAGGQWLNYFGFFAGSSPGLPDEMEATSTFANTIFITCFRPDECDARLQEAQHFNLHAVVSFIPGGNQPYNLPPPGSSTSTVQAWQTAFTNYWSSFTSVFSPYVANGTIAAFYPYDEPFGAEWSAGNNAMTTTSYLNTVASIIKNTFPNTKVAMVFTGTLTFTYLKNAENIIPQNYDWIGIDIYNCWTGCQDPQGQLNQNYSWYVQELEQNLYPNQKVILLPGTAIYVGESYTAFQGNQNGWPGEVQLQTGYVQDILGIAATDSHVVGVFGFLYQALFVNASLSAGTTWIGADDPTMTPMMNALVNFGQTYLGRGFSSPSGPTGFVAGEPVELVNQNSQKCLDVTGVATGNNIPLQQYDCLGAGELNQMWRLYQASSGHYELISLSNNFYQPTMCVDLQNGSPANGTTIQQYQCLPVGSNPNQLWKLVPVGSGYEVVAAATGNCMGVGGAAVNDGGSIQSQQCVGGTDQIWELQVPALRASNAAAQNPLF
jgi:hypothetical protein